MNSEQKAIIKAWLNKQDDPFKCLAGARNICNIEYLVWFVLKDEYLRAEVINSADPSQIWLPIVQKTDKEKQ